MNRVLRFQSREKTHDYFGLLSIPLAAIELASFFVFPGTDVQREPRVAVICGLLAIMFAITGIANRRGKSIAGWTTLAAYLMFLILFR